MAHVNTGARLNRREARARLGRGPRVGTMIRPPGVTMSFYNRLTLTIIYLDNIQFSRFFENS